MSSATLLMRSFGVSDFAEVMHAQAEGDRANRLAEAEAGLKAASDHLGECGFSAHPVCRTRKDVGHDHPQHSAPRRRRSSDQVRRQRRTAPDDGAADEPVSPRRSR
ncbi:hypothetical protein ACFWUU_12945 [Kribbella sp. NPDC058693]|uniref:hypothetical protein n=1 Tax=Kribbella sp. NPDC058693 TaxID=3346602 RepID=UPI00366234A1